MHADQQLRDLAMLRRHSWCALVLFKRIRAFRRAKVDDAMCREMWAEGHGCSVAEGKWPWK